MKPKPLPELSEQVAANFWKQVDKTTHPLGCWVWNGAKSSAGYGYYGVNYRSIRVHRISWKLTYGKDPYDLILHRCDNRACVNPDHLFEGSCKDNIHDAVRKGRWPTGSQHPSVLRPETRPRGESHANSKLNDEKVKQMRALHAQGLGQRQIAPIFGVSNYCAWSVISNRTWRHV